MKRRISLPVIILMISPVVIGLTMVLSIAYGAKHMEWGTIWNAFFHFDSGNVDHQIVRTSRLPRAIGALLIGAFLAISGALMQGMTNNYLASPSIMGVSDGAALAITIGMVISQDTSSMQLITYSFIGSALGVSLVYGLASLVPGGLSPVKMAIIGTIIGTFLSSFAAALGVYFQVSKSISFWFNARLHQMDPEMIKLAVPFAIVGIALAVFLSKSITILSLGEEVAAGLGQRTAIVKALSLVAVALLTGVSVALAGKIAFVGLIIPHIARYLIGVDYRWVIPVSAVIGAAFLGLADVLSRFLNYPFETPIGVVTAVIGIPFFLYLIRRKGGGQHA
jgi:iron complex transport system permease protein